jgi:hypothetical protein
VFRILVFIRPKRTPRSFPFSVFSSNVDRGFTAMRFRHNHLSLSYFTHFQFLNLSLEGTLARLGTEPRNTSSGNPATC